MLNIAYLSYEAILRAEKRREYCGEKQTNKTKQKPEKCMPDLSKISQRLCFSFCSHIKKSLISPKELEKPPSPFSSSATQLFGMHV